MDLLASLADSPSMSEKELLDQFIIQYQRDYNFTEDYYQRVTILILENRLNSNKLIQTPELFPYILKVLQCLRILTRDVNNQQAFIQQDGISRLGEILTEYIQLHFKDLQAPHISELIVEISCIIRRLGTLAPEVIIENNIVEQLVLLLGSTHAIVARSSLEALQQLQNEPNFSQCITNTSAIEMLVRIASEYDKEYVLLACNLLNQLCQTEDFSRKLRMHRGNLLLLDQFRRSRDLQVTSALLRLMETLCMETENATELRKLGMVQLLIEMLQNEQLEPLLAILALNLLTQMSFDDETSIYIRSQAAHLIVRRLFMYHPLIFQTEDEKMQQAFYEVQLYSLKTLRNVYSLERNRKFFRRIFPVKIFEKFIDVGNYVKQIGPYQDCLEQFNKLNQQELDTFENNIQELKNISAFSTFKMVNGYTVVEAIGKGAYGAVYEVHKGENRYALKEIPLESIEGTEDEFHREVAIYKELDHPNIVKFHTSFVENNILYIVMELIEGQTLTDFIQSLKDKGQRLLEGQIWRYFIQMCTGVRYLHNDKKVVHRDFTPSNLMITRDNQIKIADFGLAKQRALGSSMNTNTNAFVGTIQYASPEMVQSKPYGFKADIWALGCILYELATLEPAFDGENPLAIARKIVEEDYIPLNPEQFSPLLVDIVQSCMTVEQERRPDIVKLAQMVGPVLFLQIDELSTKCRSLQKQQAQEISLDAPRIALKSTQLRKVDPVQPLLETLHKLIFVSQLPPGIQRDSRRSMLETYKHWLFSDPQRSHFLKRELGRLHQCAKEEIRILSQERVTYETLNFLMEEVLSEAGYYSMVRDSLENN